MERHEVDAESSIHQLQDAAHVTLHGGGRGPDGVVPEKPDQGIRR